MKKNIAIVAGGTSSEYVISMRSAETVLDCLDRTVFEPYLIVVEHDRWYAKVNGQEIPVNKDNFSVLIGQETVTFAAVYNIIHGTPGEDGKIQGYFDILGIPYTGCDVLTSAITFSKSICKQLVQIHGVTTPRSVTVTQHDEQKIPDIAPTIYLPLLRKTEQRGL